MRTIAFVTQKGGSGKSTLASSIAVIAAQGGERVVILDMDPQSSLLKWARIQKRDDVGVEAVTAAKLPAVLEALSAKGVTLAVIDTPGGQSAAFDAAVRCADLSIIPARPNAFDLWSSAMTRKAIADAKRQYVFLLNQCPPAQQTQRVKEGAKALEDMGALLTPLVSARVDYQEAARRGLGVTEIAHSGAAAEEIRGVWASIRKRLSPGKPVSVRATARSKVAA